MYLGENLYWVPLENLVLGKVSGLCEILGKTFYPNLYSFVWRRHVCVPFRDTNMAAGNQQKHLFLSFPTYA